jgi:hypothetical protein
MRRKTAAEFCDLSEAAFEREVIAGRLPQPITLGGRDHWHRPALEAALARIAGEMTEEPEYLKRHRQRYG